MKLIRVCSSDGFKTYCKDKVERTAYRGKTYICSRFIDYPKTNVLTIKKQKMAQELINKGANLEEISEILGVKFSVLYMWYSHSRLDTISDE